MSKENSRAGYEFRKYAKQAIRRRDKGRCAVTGTKAGTQKHHALPVWMAKKYVPYHKKEIIRSGHNGITLRADIHQELHSQMTFWEDSTLANFAIGLYAHLESEYYKSAIPAFTPEEVNHRQLTSNREIVIYAAVGD